MKITLNIKDRLNIKQLLPEKGNITEQMIVKDILEKTKITTEEIKKINLKNNSNGMITWNNDKAKEIEFDFSDSEKNVIETKIKELDSKKQINQDILPLVIKLTK